jgi:hypothetical protein
MANHNLPTVTSNYVDVLSELDGRLDDIAKGLDPANTTATNVPTNSIRWSSASNKWEKWNGSAWADLSSAYVFTSITATGLNNTGNTTLGDSSADSVTINGTIGAGIVISGATTSDALRITQTGTGNALLVEDSANPDATPFVIDASGQVIKGYTTTVATGNDAGSSFTPGTQIHAISSQGQASLGLFNWINSAGNESNLVFSHSKSGVIGTFGAVSSADSLGAIVFAGDDGTAFITAAKIASEVDGTPGTNDMPGRLLFSTTADGASSPTERMRITSAGNVGIGTTAPAVEFEVSSATGSATPVPTEIRISTTTVASDYSTTLPWGRLSYYSADTSDTGPKIQGSIDFVADFAAGGRGSMVFNTSASTTGTLTERMRISTANGIIASTSITVGYTVPVDTVTFSGSAITPQFQVHGVGLSSSSASLSSWSSTATSSSSFVFNKSNSGTVGTRGVVTSSSNLGSINFAGDDGTNFIAAASIVASVDGTPGTNDMPGRLTFNTTPDGSATYQERMRITSAGNVGIGTSTPTGKLGVVGTLAGSLEALELRNLTANRAVGRGSRITFYNPAGSSTQQLSAAISSGNQDLTTNGSEYLAFETGTGGTIAERMRIDSSGNVLIGKTSATANGGDLQVSSGITFPATQVAKSDANTLDDYEEGTWTPQYTFATSGTATMVSSSGAYTKVGRMVTVNFVAVTSSISSPTGQATITGLPFTPAATYIYGGAVGEVRRFGTDMPNLRLGINPSDPSIILYKQATNSTTNTFVDGSDFLGTANYNRLHGTLTYFV